MRLFFISCLMESCQRVFLLRESISITSLFVLGIIMPNLVERSQCFDFNLDIMRLRFLGCYQSNMQNAGSYCKLFLMAYSAKSTGYEFLRSLSLIQSLDSLFHVTKSSHPEVVHFLRLSPRAVVNVPSLMEMTISSWRWSIISRNILCWWPSSSTWERISFAITFAVSISLCPLINSTLYYLVSRRGLLCLFPIGESLGSSDRFFIVADIGVKLGP